MHIVDAYAAARAATLFKAYRRPLARAVTVQIQMLVPRYRALEQGAMVRNFEHIIDAVELLLSNGDAEPILAVLDEIIAVRQASNFLLSDFTLACLTTFPVVRRFFLGRCEDAHEGLRYFESYEAFMLPVVGSVIDSFVREAEFSANLPTNFYDITRLSSQLESNEPFAIAPVEEID